MLLCNYYIDVREENIKLNGKRREIMSDVQLLASRESSREQIKAETHEKIKKEEFMGLN